MYDADVMSNGYPTMPELYILIEVFHYSGLKFTIIALSFLAMKNSTEPLAKFPHMDFINLVSIAHGHTSSLLSNFLNQKISEWHNLT